MGIAAVDNFKRFASSKPPLMVFMICLGFFAVILLSLAYYVKTQELTNPDISQDWNVFLENFSDLEFCILNDTSSTANTTNSLSNAIIPTSMMSSSLQQRNATTFKNVDLVRNYSVQMLLSVTPTKQFIAIPHNVTQLSGTVSGQLLGLADELADELMTVTVELPYNWNATHCTDVVGCDSIDIVACVHFYAQSNMFPSSGDMIPTCEALNETGIEWHGEMRAHKPKSTDPMYFCRSRPRIQVHYKFNPSLSVWLTLHDRSIINLHLMHTSYFLFVMVIMLFAYALIRTHKPRYSPAPSVDQMST